MKSMTPITYPQLGPEMVQALNKVLPENFHVSTRRIPEDLREPGKTYLIVNLTGGDSRHDGLGMMAAYNFIIEASDDNAADEAAWQLLTLIQAIRAYPFYWVENSSVPIPFMEDGSTTAKRLISVRALVQGISL